MFEVQPHSLSKYIYYFNSVTIALIIVCTHMQIDMHSLQRLQQQQLLQLPRALPCPALPFLGAERLKARQQRHLWHDVNTVFNVWQKRQSHEYSMYNLPLKVGD